MYSSSSVARMRRSAIGAELWPGGCSAFRFAPCGLLANIWSAPKGSDRQASDMAYFISVGRFKGLKGGIGSRGWQIWRRGKVVIVRWGPIEILNGYPKRIFWAAECQP